MTARPSAEPFEHALPTGPRWGAAMALGDAPADIGNGLVSASLASGGAWLSMGAPHSRYGFVELTGLPEFEPSSRGDPTAVRRYRAYMTSPMFSFLHFEIGSSRSDRAMRSLALDDVTTSYELRVTHHRHEITTRALPHEPRVEQCHRLTVVQGHGPTPVIVHFRGRLDAHPLPEITDIDPPAPTRARSRLVAGGQRLLVEAPALPAAAEIDVCIEGGASMGWVVAGRTAHIALEWGRHAPPEARLVVTCSLREPDGPYPRAGGASAAAGRASLPSSRAGERMFRSGRPLHMPASKRDRLTRLVDRTRAYVLDCTAVCVGVDEICLLTDHRILPLSWTRDAYWQAAMLLAHRPDGTAVDTVAGHLRWLWGRCERPETFWMRSHHSSGAIKDVAFQADQQLYPLLELADFRRVAGRLPAPPSDAQGESHVGWWAGKVRELWDALPVGELGFLSSDETAADDEAKLPYPVSAQILYWLAARSLADLDEELRLGRDFDGTARRLAEAISTQFHVNGPFGSQWAYEIDGRGGHRLYHDANDLPTALAPLLGFCTADDPVWTATMRFAFSANNPGYSGGPFGGLGSRHTPGTWTLGDVQEWAVASLVGEPDAAERALDRLLAVATPDGLLPEAYDSSTGGDPVRHWFAWPGAALGTLLPLAA